MCSPWMLYTRPMSMSWESVVSVISVLLLVLLSLGYYQCSGLSCQKGPLTCNKFQPDNSKMFPGRPLASKENKRILYAAVLFISSRLKMHICDLHFLFEFLNMTWVDYIIEKEPLVNKFISVPSDGGKVTYLLIYDNSVIIFVSDISFHIISFIFVILKNVWEATCTRLCLILIVWVV